MALIYSCACGTIVDFDRLLDDYFMEIYDQKAKRCPECGALVDLTQYDIDLINQNDIPLIDSINEFKNREGEIEDLE